MDPFSASYAAGFAPPPAFLSVYYPDGLPDTYLVLDVATSGLDPAVDLAVGIGSLQLVEDLVPPTRLSVDGSKDVRPRRQDGAFPSPGTTTLM